MTTEMIRALMLSWFIAHNYQHFQAEALIRDAWIESRLTPCVIARSGSEGLFQWVASRRRKLHQFGGPGCVPIEAQLAFADHELRTESRYRQFWRAGPARVFGVLRACFERGRC